MEPIILGQNIVEIVQGYQDLASADKTFEQKISEIFTGPDRPDDLKADQDRFRKWILEKTIHTYEGWPHPTTPKLPAYCITPQRGSEKADRYAHGDILRTGIIPTEYDPETGNPIRGDKLTTYGVEWDSSFSIESWSLNGELTPLMNAFIKHMLFRYNRVFTKFGVTEMEISEENFHPNMEMYSAIPYVQAITLRIEHFWEQTERRTGVKFNTKTTFNPGSFSN